MADFGIVFAAFAKPFWSHCLSHAFCSISLPFPLLSGTFFQRVPRKGTFQNFRRKKPFEKEET
jgi:hypothetical protein